jgi:hypothetical protein
MLRGIAAYLTTPVGIAKVTAPLHDGTAAVVCVSRAWRAALPAKPRGHGNCRLTVVAPRALFMHWLRTSQWTFLVHDFAIPVGVLVRRALAEMGLPAGFFACALDMLAPTGRHPTIVLECALAPGERLVVVNDYTEPELRGRSRRSFVDGDWAYRSALMPVPKWIFKLPEANHLLHVEAVMPVGSLVLLGAGSQAVHYDLETREN